MANTNNLTICLTGAKGFIGSRLIQYLSKENDITILPFEGDLLDSADVEDFFQKNKVDQIIHLAGLFAGNEKELIEANFQTTLNLLEATKKFNIKKLIFSSTGAVYGEPVRETSIETDELKPNTFYGFSKKIAEDAIHYYSNNHGLKYVILRFPNVYGENNNKGVVYHFLTNIKERGEVTLYGDGTQSRNFLHVDDACQSIHKSIFFEKSDTFNISNPKKVSLNDLLSLLSEEHDFKINRMPANNNLKDLLLNIEKAEKLLKFKPGHKNIKL